MADEKGSEQILLSFHKNFVKEGLPGTEGTVFNAVTIPPGTEVDGKDISNFTFYPKFVNHGQNENNADMRYVPLPKTNSEGERWMVTLTKDLGQSVEAPDGTKVWEPQRDADGNALQEKVEVSSFKLSHALAEQRKAYRENSQAAFVEKIKGDDTISVDTVAKSSPGFAEKADGAAVTPAMADLDARGNDGFDR
jgi:hypothetical protein